MLQKGESHFLRDEQITNHKATKQTTVQVLKDYFAMLIIILILSKIYLNLANKKSTSYLWYSFFYQAHISGYLVYV